MIKRLQGFLKDDQGATAIEYGLVVASISVAALIAMKGLGIELSDAFSNIQVQLAQSENSRF